MLTFTKLSEGLAEEGKIEEAVIEADKALRIIEIVKGEESGNLAIYENYLRKMKECFKTP